MLSLLIELVSPFVMVREERVAAQVAREKHVQPAAVVHPR